MRILIAGGSGFLGTPLTAALTAAGHEVIIVSRQPVGTSAGPVGRVITEAWPHEHAAGRWASDRGPFDAIINLAGASIGDVRWSPARKALLVSSRINTTRTLVTLVEHATPRPALLINASAVGFYGNCGEQTLTEEAPAGSDFLATLCRDWEAAAQTARHASTRVVLLRTGLVLDTHGGALARMLLPFKLGVGGPFGSGRQYVSWIHRDDWVRLVVWLLGASGVDGPVNAVSPLPVTNADFAAALGRAMHRPSALPAPAFALKAALGEMAEPLLLFSQRVLPARATRAGWVFQHPTLDGALAHLLI
ncbi:MAG: TIGR01777 family oxidoreductase [Acidobacteriota bacterium]